MASQPQVLSMLMFMLLSIIVGCNLLSVESAGDFNQDVDIIWGDGRAKILNNGSLFNLSLDRASGSGFQSKKEYLFGKIDMQIKLVTGNSAGTVTAFYLKSQGTAWDEIDFEFLGNLSDDPYIVSTNVFTQGKGDREQRFYLWFDPTEDFHTYSILWNPGNIVFYVDGRPIREFKNWKATRVAYPHNQPMRMYCTLWDGEDWATRGGQVKTDWSKAPFTASFRKFHSEACVWSNGASSCPNNSNSQWYTQRLDLRSQKMLKSVQQNYMIYNYCKDTERFPQGLPVECIVKNKNKNKIV